MGLFRQLIRCCVFSMVCNYLTTMGVAQEVIPAEIINERMKMRLQELRQAHPQQGPIEIVRVQRPAMIDRNTYSLQMYRTKLGPQFHTTRIDGKPQHVLVLTQEDAQYIINHYMQQYESIRDAYLRHCDLDNRQLEKLSGAVTTEAIRLIRNTRAAFEGDAEAQRERQLDPVQLRQAINVKLFHGISTESSLFARVLESTLDPGQRTALIHARGADLLDMVDACANYTLDKQMRYLGVPYPTPGSEPELIKPLNAPQREHLLLQMQAAADPDLPLVILADPARQINLLAGIETAELESVLTSPQIQAVLHVSRRLDGMR